MRSPEEVKTAITKNRAKWAAVYRQLRLCCRQLERLDGEQRRLHKRLKLARRQAKDYNARYRTDAQGGVLGGASLAPVDIHQTDQAGV